jgi:hypothetical protein
LVRDSQSQLINVRVNIEESARMLIIKKDCSFSRTNKPIEAEDDEE